MNLSTSRNTLISFGFWVLLAAACIVILYPFRDRLRLGIDLVGGTYLTLEVKTEEAVDAELAEKMQKIVSELKKAGKQLPLKREVKDQVLTLTFDHAEAAQLAGNFLSLSDIKLKQVVDGSSLKLTMDERDAQRVKDEAVKNNIEVLHARLNKLNVEETPVTRQGERNIVVELPGVEDVQKAKSMIGRMAKLEFKLVEKSGGSREDILYELEGEELPPDKEILRGRDGMQYLVPRYTDITGRLLKDARPGLGGKTGLEPVVKFRFDDVGAERFYELTRKSFGKQLAIILDGTVLLAPGIHEPLREGGEIIGRFTKEEVEELATLIKSGSFTARVTFEEDRQVGPSLGQEVINKGLISCAIGLALLLLFGVFYYKLSGILSFVALLYNLLLILVGMYFLGATLTLPGIAGLVLTVGMAIDCSILIYEHIREELEAGMTLRKAVNAGFDGAMVIILDSNITHLLTSLVLYKFGTGPIQGFAVTLMLGIIATLLTGLTFLRSLFNFIIEVFDIKKLSI